MAHLRELLFLFADVANLELERCVGVDKVVASLRTKPHLPRDNAVSRTSTKEGFEWQGDASCCSTASGSALTVKSSCHVPSQGATEYSVEAVQPTEISITVESSTRPSTASVAAASEPGADISSKIHPT
jgi:hypothetical protein